MFRVLVIVLLIFSPQLCCADDLLGGCLGGLIGQACWSIFFDAVTKPFYVPPDFTEIERFYLEGQPRDDLLGGLRIMENVEELTHPMSSRITFKTHQWQDLFQSESLSSTQFRELIHNSDGELLPVQYNKFGYIEEVRLDDQGLVNSDTSSLFVKAKCGGKGCATFNAHEFFTYTESILPETSKISIYEFNLMTFYSRADKALRMIIIPGLQLNSVKSIIDTSAQEKENY